MQSRISRTIFTVFVLSSIAWTQQIPLPEPDASLRLNTPTPPEYFTAFLNYQHRIAQQIGERSKEDAEAATRMEAGAAKAFHISIDDFPNRRWSFRRVGGNQRRSCGFAIRRRYSPGEVAQCAGSGIFGSAARRPESRPSGGRGWRACQFRE
jgi:hypothetical protein